MINHHMVCFVCKISVIYAFTAFWDGSVCSLKMPVCHLKQFDAAVFNQALAVFEETADAALLLMPGLQQLLRQRWQQQGASQTAPPLNGLRLSLL